MSILDLTDSVMNLIPDYAGWDVYRNREPPATANPPWVILTCTTGGHVAVETMDLTAHVGTLEVRVASTSTDSVNVLCDDKLIPLLNAAVPAAPSGVQVGCLTLRSDSGAYAAGLTADDTSRRYRVRVLTFRFGWSRL
ncbi:transcriptional regulator [Bifidobacterium sp. SO4]|uniref:transcriptional regulator n=1 Tax=Bifidobacterium sp. SO4 TaxID=2809030 RepID=UPI001BDD0C52|nr:transcriptional regulator [Bifidobacterium sp. SO4]MBT1171274.1 transcriptional regulator [Bifidobacterium sp. SO4]